jgi:hypothetical protein
VHPADVAVNVIEVPGDCGEADEGLMFAEVHVTAASWKIVIA